MKEQLDYTKFYEETPVDQLAIYDCGGIIDIGEQIIIKNKIKPKTVLDLGCGMGRLFDYYKFLNIDFVGVEKSKNWISSSQYENKIIHLDVSDFQFIDKLKGSHINLSSSNYDLVGLFGGVIHGFIDPVLRKQAWYNISSLINKSNHLVISTLCDYEWFEYGSEGKLMRLLDQIPFQYFYSKKELENIFSELNLRIIDTLEFPNPLNNFEKMKSIYYVLVK